MGSIMQRSREVSEHLFQTLGVRRCVSTKEETGPCYEVPLLTHEGVSQPQEVKVSLLFWQTTGGIPLLSLSRSLLGQVLLVTMF